MKRALLGLVVLGLAGVTACGSSSPPATADPTPAVTSSAPVTSQTPSATPTPSPTPTPTPSPSPSGGPKSATCVNGWTDAAAGSDFYGQATQAVTDTLKAPHALSRVRYFAGPLVAGGIGAVYYVELADPQLPVRLVIVSGGGPSAYAVAPSGTHGWQAGDWTGFAGTEAPAAHPPLPGTWAGPAYDAVTGASALLSPQLAGCLAGT